MESGRVIWITGLSGSGKTTLANALQDKLPGSILLDGDELREVLESSSHGFDKNSRLKLAQIYSRLAGLLAKQGHIVIVATISLFHELHEQNRAMLPGYLEIFLDVQEEERRRRDPKGLYAANAPQMASSYAEIPRNPHLRLNGTESLEESVTLVLNLLEMTKAEKTV